MPAGSSKRDARAQEVYEASKGRFNQGIPVPDSYYYSAGKGQMAQTLRYAFDWENKQLKASNRYNTESIALSDNSQDRLSYLLLSTQLTEPQEPASVRFPLVGFKKQH